MAKKKMPAGSILTCEQTGVEFPYKGYGRPPKFCPAVREEREKARRRRAYDNRQAKKGKTVTRKAA